MHYIESEPFNMPALADKRRRLRVPVLPRSNAIVHAESELIVFPFTLNPSTFGGQAGAIYYELKLGEKIIAKECAMISPDPTNGAYHYPTSALRMRIPHTFELSDDLHVDLFSNVANIGAFGALTSGIVGYFFDWSQKGTV